VVSRAIEKSVTTEEIEQYLPAAQPPARRVNGKRDVAHYVERGSNWRIK